MAFPSDLEIEAAFNNDIDETTFAQSGWTSILPFVSGFSGDLRGRSYELDSTEAGTLSVTLDNSDGRFIPGSVQSPYYPYVKSGRRFRVRGKNMVHPNVARGGSRDRDLTGFVIPNQTINLAQYTALSNPTMPFTQSVHAMDDVRVITASAEPNAGIGQGKEKVNDGLATTKWTINTQAGSITYKLPVGVRIQRYTLTVPAGNPNNNPKTWTLQGSNNGSSFTTIHTVTGNTWTAGDYESQEFTVTSPNFYLYYKLDITANVGATSATQLAEFVINYNDAATDLLLVDKDLTHYTEVNVTASNPANSSYRRTAIWFIPVEYGVRLAHSAYLWRISGTEPTGAKLKLDITYWDENWQIVNPSVNPSWEITTLPTTTTPTQIGFSHTPPAEAKYGVVSFLVFIAGTTNTTDLIYGLTGIQSELPANLAPDISGFRDQFNWAIEGGDSGTYTNVGSDPTTSYMSVVWDVDDVNIFTVIPHLIPGELYTATVQAKKLTGQPDVQFTGDEGQSGPLISTTTFTQYTCTFEAQSPEQELRFILQGTPLASEGLQIRKLRVEKGDSLALTLPTTAIESGFTTWLRPKDIFEGWVENWPAVGGTTEMTITVVDRMNRVGKIDLANTLQETLLQDSPKLLMPLTDSMLDTPGRFSQLGKWANEIGGPTFVDITPSKGDVSAASYTTNTDDGPTGEASFLSTPTGSALTSKGYFFAIPYSKDFDNPTTPPAGPPGSHPPPASTPTDGATYTKKWTATWSRSYEGDNSTRFDDSPYMYQGSFDTSSPGNQKSLAGFDYKNIQATLAGAEILEAHFTIKNSHARWNKGLYAEVGVHTYSSKPSTWSGASVTERKWKKWVTEGGSLTIDIGASTGRAFRDGTTKGLAIGPEATNDHDNYGYFFGASHSARPSLTIKYRK
jgi:hypothetical protein